MRSDALLESRAIVFAGPALHREEQQHGRELCQHVPAPLREPHRPQRGSHVLTQLAAAFEHFNEIRSTRA